MDQLGLRSDGGGSGELNSSDERQKKQQKIITMVCAIFSLTIFVLLTIFFARYTFKNPDPSSCWVVRDVDSSARTRAGVLKKADDLGIDVTEGYPVDMGRVFGIWFAWGFWSNVVAILGAITTFVLTSKNAYAAKVVQAVTSLGYLVNWFVWLAIGTIWRFSKAGTTASGDKLEREFGVSDDAWETQLDAARSKDGYQVSGGSFMKALIMISIVFAFVLILGMAITMIVMCLGSPMPSEDDKDSKAEQRQATANFDDEDREKSDVVYLQNRENMHGSNSFPKPKS